MSRRYRRAVRTSRTLSVIATTASIALLAGCAVEQPSLTPDTKVHSYLAVDKRTFVDNYRTPHTESMHVTERWKLIDDGKLLEVNIRVDDPETFYEPWNAIQRYRRVQQRYTEQACAEGNARDPFFDYNVPIANKPDF